MPSVRPQEHWQSVICRGQPVTLSRAAHDLVQASSSYGTPSDLSPVTPFSSASSESAEASISRASTPSFRKSAVRPKDVIKRLQAKVSRYRKAITRLRKQEQKAPQTATEALAMIRPHVTEEVFQLVSSHMKLRRNVVYLDQDAVVE
ncbi:uncharacterized protein LOC121838209 [Ixodes scapularis]|uniref:uncharacterized protein LOC121838209 n=1 Tax=Ixodes scapularis TaxID=6945 RepID=UPI001C395330|nr:uncharacterized protein LOC121838209 [Ixodes scapularis]